MRIFKKVIVLVIIAILCISFISYRYASQQDPVEKDIETIKKIANAFEDELEHFGIDKETVDEIVAEIEEYNKETKYVITFDVQNDTNPILSTTLHLPVDEAFFNSVEIGDIIAKEKLQVIEDFMQLDENFGSWVIVIKDKEIRE